MWADYFVRASITGRTKSFTLTSAFLRQKVERAHLCALRSGAASASGSDELCTTLISHVTGLSIAACVMRCHACLWACHMRHDTCERRTERHSAQASPSGLRRQSLSVQSTLACGGVRCKPRSKMASHSCCTRGTSCHPDGQVCVPRLPGTHVPRSYSLLTNTIRILLQSYTVIYTAVWGMRDGLVRAFMS